MSVLTTQQKTYPQEQAQEIYNHMSNLKIGEHNILTSELKDSKQHRRFPTIANELRKKGLKVKSQDNWGATTWTIYL